MKNYKIKISGMTCSSCEETVSKSIRSLADIIEVNVSFKSNTADIQAKKNISIEIHEAYRIKSEESYLKKLYPLGLILFYISITSTLLNLESSFENFMLDFMGLFFIVFSFFKFLDYKSFPISFAMYDPLAKVILFYGWLYPFIETILGLMFLFRFQLFNAIVITIFLLSITTYGVIKTLRNKKKIQCACLGTAIKLPMTIATLIENGIMILMAIVSFINMYV